MGKPSVKRARSISISTLAAAGCAALGVLGAAPALAGDSVTAEALFNKGVADIKAGKFESGCPAVAESQKLDPRPGTQFTLSECLARWGKIASAVVAYEDYLRSVDALPKAQQARYAERNRIAESQKAALKPLIPELTIVLPGDAPAGTIVRRDGTEISGPSLGLALPVDPGEHLITVEAPGRPPGEQRITLDKGDKKSLTAKIPEVAPKEQPGGGEGPAPLEPDAKPGKGRTIGAFVAGGFGVAGLVMGGVTGGLAVSKKSTADEHCKEFKCDQEGLAAVESGRTMGLLSTIGLAVGGAGAATAAILWFTRPKEAKEASSIHVDVLVGSAGAALGVKGEF